MVGSVLIAGALFPHASADETTEGWDVTVEDAMTASAEDGEHSVLQFRLDNASSQDFVLRAARTPVAGSARLMMRMPVVGPMAVRQVLVPSGEIVDFSTNHLWIEIGPLMRGLLPDETIEFELIFDGWTLPAEAHVHEFEDTSE